MIWLKQYERGWEPADFVDYPAVGYETVVWVEGKAFVQMYMHVFICLCIRFRIKFSSVQFMK